MVVFVMLAMSVVASVAPMGSFIALIWFLDRYDREPVWLMALTFLWGAVGAVLISIVVSGLFTIPIALIAPESQMALGTAIIAPLVEEPAKALVLHRAMECAGTRIELARDFFNSGLKTIRPFTLFVKDGLEAFQQCGCVIHGGERAAVLRQRSAG